MLFKSLLPLAFTLSTSHAAFNHPGLLHTAADFSLVTSKVNAKTTPWITGWEKLLNNSHSAATYTASPVALICRGTPASCTQNYVNLYRDAAAAYALALRWKISGDATYGEAATKVLNAWASTATEISGNSDKYLASGLYGYQLANAAEIMRTYKGYTAANLKAMATMLTNVFYPMNHRFLVEHNDGKIDHYWANWDLCNMATMQSIGILADNQTMYNEAIDYFYHGAGNGGINQTIWKFYTDGTGQIQESGRDQGHTMLDIALLGVFAQTAYNQGTNLFTYDDHRILKGAEYAAKYNLGNDVQYTTYVNSDVTQTNISSAGRGNIRPVWELLYNHYVKVEKLTATYTTQYATLVRNNGGGAEGGGGDYGTTSGGYDQLGYGTLMYSK